LLHVSTFCGSAGVEVSLKGEFVPRRRPLADNGGAGPTSFPVEREHPVQTVELSITIPSGAAIVLHVGHNAQRAAPRTNVYLGFGIPLNWNQLRQRPGVV